MKLFLSSKIKVFSHAVLLVCFSAALLAQTPPPQAREKPYTVEYYYKARWGYADEFLRLYKKNHLPVMKKEQEMGRILSLSMTKPRLHSTEEGRWDFRVTIVWRSVQVTDDGFDEEALIKRLYPDQETYKREEQRRFDILLSHYDVPIVEVDLTK